jgi:5-formyltetrahydrofolate cyclo-ligase
MCKEKDDIRSEMLGIRAEIPPAEAKKAGSAVIDGLLSFLSQHTFPEQKRGITLFSSIRGEIDLLPEAYRFEEIGFDICLPRIDHEKMHFFRYHTSDPLTPGVFGIQEPVSSAQIVSPAQIAIAVCPGLAFDVAGYRIGYGKGFYDQYFAQYQKGQCPIMIGAAYPFQVLAHVPQGITDVRMDYIFLPGSFLPCRGTDLTEDSNGIDNT